MPNYQVFFTKSARREFDRLPENVQQRVVDALQVLGSNPFSELLSIKKLRGAPSLYRVRLGDYRVVYTLEKDRLVVTIIKIGHRREVYHGV